ncbi:putative regulator of G-protein signaling 3-like [Scophthalmus maximus]|uniref:Putative regulator of G-protein signaling 3-like n=1 Tax=Scophthalmus maximus TaxID=52904 RepID=A0A2U9BWK4_SCOMX|nr:putative regulator of G-protein signaling 3-like [Scophthalmus maximus]
MFWKNTAWSWDDAAGNDDDDDGGYLLAADLRQTPDSPPDTNLNHVTTSTGPSNCTTSTAGLKDQINHSWTHSGPHGLDPHYGPTNTTYSGYVSTLYTNNSQLIAARDRSSQLLTVNIIRGTDGFGFTICSDCPVRVQAVDPGGPAHKSGLRHGDSVLQLNGLPVETWKCVELAHAIRSCPSHIVLVVWRGLPELRSGSETLLRPPTDDTTTGRKLLPHPAHSKDGHRRGQGFLVKSSFAALGSLWRDRKEEEDLDQEEDQEEEVEEYSRHTTTLKGTRVTSSNGDNYIILSPVNPGGHHLHPVYHDRTGTIGHLYQTHPSRDQNLLHSPRSGSTLPPPLSSTPSSSSSAMPSNYGNYQNCTIVQSHLPCSGYESYATLAPKTLIFPIFVQPLDLCSSDRTLLMSEEMILHQADLLPAKVSDRDWGSGGLGDWGSGGLGAWCFRFKFRFNFWFNFRFFPSYMKGSGGLGPPSPCSSSSPPLFSIHTSSSSSSSPPSRTISVLHHVLPPPPSSSCSNQRSHGRAEEDERRKRRREEVEEEEERQQGEGESASETSERVGGRGLLLKEEEFTYRPAVLRRSLSEGSLLQEPRSSRFLSDSTIHRVSCAVSFDPDPRSGSAPLLTSPHTLRKQLTGQGGSLHHMLLLLNGTKDHHLREKTKSLADDVWRSLSFLRRRKNCTLFHGSSLDKALRNKRPSPREVLKWAESLEALLTNQYGLVVFRHFLRSEFSEENLDFWLAVERFKRIRPLSKMAARATKIYEEFISTNAVRQVNVDSSVREWTNHSLRLYAHPTSFNLAQDQIFGLMETESYPRFLRSRLFARLANQTSQPPC